MHPTSLASLPGETLVAYCSWVDPPDQLRSSQRETLQGGPARAPLLDRFTPAWRHRGITVLAFVFGVLTGGGAVWWWNDRLPEELRSPPAGADTSVRLVLSGVAARTRPDGRNATIGAGPLWIDGALLHSRGTGTATVMRIHRPGRSLAIRVPALPIRLSANHSFERIRLQISPRNCALATQWTPSAQPFTLTWQDDHGDLQVDIGGDHDAAMELSLIRHMDAVCGNPRTQ